MSWQSFLNTWKIFAKVTFLFITKKCVLIMENLENTDKQEEGKIIRNDHC